MKLLKRFIRDESGNFAVIFAVSALPIMLITSAALDMRYAERVDNNLQDALDKAVLAAVANPNLTGTQRQAYAAEIFNKNFDSKSKAILSYPIETNPAVFSLAGEVNVPSTLGAMVDIKTIAVDAVSSAILEESGSVCVLSLAPDGANRVSFADNAAFSAPNCTVQVNSNSDMALTNQSTIAPDASGFCAVGSGRGQFSPPHNSECAPVPDPYKDLTQPSDTRCLSYENLRALSSQFSLMFTGLSNPKNDVTAENATGSNVRIWPGIYCQGLTVDGIDVQFMPGTYVIKDGDLTFKNISQAEALGVTFVLIESQLKIELGAELRVKAPKNGAYPGIAFFQVPPEADNGETLTYPTGVSTLSSGGQLDVEGTLYFPTQSLEISGESYFGSQAKATSFIAYEVGFSGNTIAQVSVDYRAAGLPPLEPRSTGGPRLLR